MFCQQNDDHSAIEELLQHDDLRPLIPLLRHFGISREAYQHALTRAQRRRSFCFISRQAQTRLLAMRWEIDGVLQIIEARANMMAKRLHRSDWEVVVNDIFGAILVLRFYRGGLPISEFDEILSYLLNVRLERIQRRLFGLWDDDGYLSHFAVDWARDVLELLDQYDRPFCFHTMQRDDFEKLARDFYAEPGHEQNCQQNQSCAICLNHINAKLELKTFCHNKGCGYIYHDACIKQWIRTKTSTGMVPKCPVCKKVWITRRYRTGFFNIDSFDKLKL